MPIGIGRGWIGVSGEGKETNLGANSVSGTELGALNILSRLILAITLQGRYYYLCFTHEESVAQKG